jgi:hypothetical protein
MIQHDFNDFNINSFHKIGWADPFPEETYLMNNLIDIYSNERIESNSNEFVYPKHRILSDKCPHPIYITNKALCFKIMRACISITTIEGEKPKARPKPTR